MIEKLLLCLPAVNRVRMSTLKNIYLIYLIRIYDKFPYNQINTWLMHASLFLVICRYICSKYIKFKLTMGIFKLHVFFKRTCMIRAGINFCLSEDLNFAIATILSQYLSSGTQAN